MKNNYIIKSFLLSCLMVLCGISYTSCDEEELDTNQFTGGVSLNVYGPCPVARGGELQFIGNGMDQITSISIPGCSDITEINKISKTKISIIVPKTAQPGFPVLHYAKGDITTKTKLNFTEPVGFAEKDAFPATAVKPGETLTIKGTYLNLVESVIFADDVEVTKLEKSSADEPMEMTIKVVVPAEAKTGKLFLGFVATGDTLKNKVLSETELIVTLPSVKEIANLTGKKPGDKIELEGSDLDLVTKVTVAGTETDYEVKEGKISFNLPTSTPDAAEIAMYPASNVKVTIATIGMTIPTEVTATPTSELREGSEIVFSGKDLDVVEKISFPAAGETAFTLTDGKISVKCPAGFTSGEVVLTCKSGIEIKIAITTQKPELEAFTPVPVAAGNNLTIKGKNLDLIKSIEFTEGLVVTEFVSQSATELVVKVPVAAVSGDLTITMTNGETVKFEKLNVDSPVFCFIPELPGEDVEIKADQIMTVAVVNGDKLTSVEVDGNACQFIMNGSELLFKVPESAGKRSVIKLISSNGEVEYEYAFIPNTDKKKVVWSGMTEITWKDGGRVFLPADAFDDVPEGAILHLCYTQKDGQWDQAQIMDGCWGKFFSWDATDNECDGKTNDEAALVPTDIYGWFSDGQLNRDTKFRLTAEKLAWLRSHIGNDGSLVIQGTGLVFTQVYITWVISLEETLAQGPIVATGWGNQPTVLTNGELSNAKPGQILRIYVENVNGWVLQLFTSGWANLNMEYKNDNWKLDEHNGAVEIELTQELLDKIKPGFILNADKVTVSKITLE